MNRISVVIPTKNRTQDVIRCLKSISFQTMLPDEVVIVDSSDTEGLEYELNQFHNLNIKYIHAEESGLALQRNVGAKVSSGDIIVFSDDDMIWDKDYLKEIMHVFSNYPVEKIGGVTGNVIFRIKKIEEQRRLIRKFLRFGHETLATIFFLTRYGNGKFQLSGMPTIVRSDLGGVTECEFLYGGSMAFRREVINEFMFDENLHGYAWGEDDDIAYRVSRKYQNVYTPHAKIIHNNAAHSTRGNKYDEMKMAIENHYYLFTKNLPKSLMHKFAFWWSVVGLFLREGIRMMRKRDANGVKGLVIGLREIAKKRFGGIRR